MANKDIFAPPSEKELNDLAADPRFAPPTAEELAPPAPEYSTVEALGKGIQQGSQLGFADELTGIGTALGSKLADTDFARFLAGVRGPTPEQQATLDKLQIQEAQPSFYEEYRAGQQAEQARQAQARKEHPWAYGTGQVVGGITTGLATAPLAAAAPVATATGAGAVQGLGESTATIEDPLGLLKDTAIGAGLGYGLSKILPGGPKSVKPEKDILKRGEFFPQLEAAKRLGEEGVSLSAKPEARQALTQRLKENVEGVAEQYIAPRKTLGKALEATIKAGDQEAFPPPMQAEFFDTVGDIADAVGANVTSIGRKRASDLMQKLDALKQGLLQPSEMNALRKELSDVAANSEIPELRSILKTGVTEIRDQIETLAPGFKEASKDFAQFAQKGPEALLSKGFDPELSEVFLGNMSRGDLKIAEKVKDLIGSIRSGGAQGLKKQEEFFSAMNQLEKLAQENPELVKKLGIDPAKLTREIISKADEAAVAQKVAGESIGQAAYERGKFGLRKASESGILKAANVYGQVKKKMRDFVSGSKEDLGQAAEALKQHGGPDLQALGDSLSNAIANNNAQARNAAIFSIMQLPSAKEILGIEGE